MNDGYRKSTVVTAGEGRALSRVRCAGFQILTIYFIALLLSTSSTYAGAERRPQERLVQAAPPSGQAVDEGIFERPQGASRCAR